MSRRNRAAHAAPGQDSFLDVVANLVGVLIILVMVVGTQARHALSAMVPLTSAVDAAPELPNVDAARQDVASAQREIAELHEKAAREDFEIAYRRDERDQLQLLITAANAEIEAAKKRLSVDDRESLELTTQLEASFRELAELEQTLAGVVSDDKPVEVVKHFPTPMAKTVFGKEIHFRLQGGNLTYVPFDEFVTRLKDDAPKQMWKLKNSERITESVGPLQGFLMKYTLKREVVSIPVSGGVARGEKAVLEHFVLVPMSNQLGEPVEKALQPGSDFTALLRQQSPKQCTVTLWVYPDSFQHFRQVRDTLLKQGFITAGRPMPEGHPIGGSPEGSRSAAQ
jgi:hypothetical protein